MLKVSHAPYDWSAQLSGWDQRFARLQALLSPSTVTSQSPRGTICLLVSWGIPAEQSLGAEEHCEPQAAGRSAAQGLTRWAQLVLGTWIEHPPRPCHQNKASSAALLHHSLVLAPAQQYLPLFVNPAIAAAVMRMCSDMVCTAQLSKLKLAAGSMHMCAACDQQRSKVLCEEPYLRHRIPLPYSDCALLCPCIKGVSVHSDCKGDAQLVCPGIPLANGRACHTAHKLSLPCPLN